MWLEILKVLLPLLGGGLAGALLNEWNRRRGAKVQAIPLIERVNRSVSPDVKGFTLARRVGEGAAEHLEEIKNVREYQFTLRNTSTVHLQDVEIQFEFASEDVEAWAERPTLSKTAPVVVDPVIAGRWKKGYRWRIPQFPCTDSIEFTFRAVNPEAEQYEVALYKSERVVIQRYSGEPTKTSRAFLGHQLLVPLVGIVMAVVFAGTMTRLVHKQDRLFSFVKEGCSLNVLSSVRDMDEGSLFVSKGPWEISYRVDNVGVNVCSFQADQLTLGESSLYPGMALSRSRLLEVSPAEIERDIKVRGLPGEGVKATKIKFHGESRP